MIRNLLTESNTFNSIVFEGNYSMPLEHFILLYEHYKLTNQNLLDDYSRVIYLLWNNENYLYWSLDEKVVNEESLSKLRHLRNESINEILIDARIKHKEAYNNYILRKQEIDNRPRKKAQLHLSKKEVRESVFKLYGKLCLCCGSGDNITIDHVIPVFKGGENNIKNYQPLCKSCNSKKGTKTIDYRRVDNG